MNKIKKKNLLNGKLIAAVLFAVFIIALFIFAFSKESVHLYKSIVTTQGDCVTPGVRTYKCIRCSYKRTESITGGHKNTDIFVIAPDGSTYMTKKCSVCGNESTEPVKEADTGNRYSLVCASVTGIEKNYQSTGRKISPVPSVTDIDGNVLTADKDYTVTYSNNISAGTASVTITGTGSYSNAIEIQFTISDMYWEEVDGAKYYYKDDQIASGLVEVDGEKYYFSEEGIMQTGWQKIGLKYYCFDRISGALAKDTVVDGIKVDKNGAAAKSEYNQYKIETMMKAHQIAELQTAATDTMEDRRLKLFNWLCNQESYRWRLLETVCEDDDWEMTFANDIFDEGKGCSVSAACAFAFLLREIGYTDIYVCHNKYTAWVMCGEKLFDPYRAETVSFDGNYDVKCTDERSAPAEKRRIDSTVIKETTD